MITLRGNWEITVVMYSGGWFSSEKLEAMMKCLLDETQEEEIHFSDMHLPYINAQKTG